MKGEGIVWTTQELFSQFVWAIFHILALCQNATTVQLVTACLRDADLISLNSTLEHSLLLCLHLPDCSMGKSSTWEAGEAVSDRLLTSKQQRKVLESWGMCRRGQNKNQRRREKKRHKEKLTWTIRADSKADSIKKYSKEKDQGQKETSTELYAPPVPFFRAWDRH